MSVASRRAVLWSIAAAATGTAAVLACGPFFNNLLTVSHSVPANSARYAGGELGVVKPAFERRYLVQAYRVLGGAPPVSPDDRPVTAEPVDAFNRWATLQARELPAAVTQTLKRINPERIGADYSSFANCLDAAFARALEAYAERAARYGARSRETIDWLAAQAAVFQNCAAGPLVLPPAAAFETDQRMKADRDYQTAAAYFYATQYDEAAGRFRAIFGNAASPWRPSGRYMAARALIRSVTVPSIRPKDAAPRLAAAERDLEATLADREAAPLHASARGLLGLIATRARPIERLHELSARLASAPAVTPQDLVDYTWLMDLALGETAAGTPPLDLAEVTKGDDMTDWIVGMQKRQARALERWRDTRSERWLVAALWSASPGDTDVPALLAAAAQVPRTSPAFSTAAFLRVRALIQRNDLAGARAALMSMPTAPGAGFDGETINLLRAARFTVAETLDELLAAAPREIVTSAGYDRPDPSAKYDKPAWDDDVAAVFNSRMPLERLVASAESTRLPTRLRLRVAQAAFTRAVVLQQPRPGVRSARVIRAIAKAASDAELNADLQRYVTATDEGARGRIATLILLHTPGLSINVGGRDDSESYQRDAPFLEFGHDHPSNWWCEVADSRGDGASTLITAGGAPFPPFITEAERRDTAGELDTLTRAGSPRVWLTTAAIAWARQRPADPEAAEALALAIEGWRWSRCSSDPPKSDVPARAFALLHRQFPQSDWAKVTKYWYD
jgi:hypothetical protein